MRKIVTVILCLIICLEGCQKLPLNSKMETETETQHRTEGGEDLNMTETKSETENPARIICWGDSLTFGEGGNGVTFPSVLEEKLKLKIVNYGVQGETARQIGIRMGAFPMTVGAFEIPAEQTAVEVTLWHSGEDPVMMRLGDCGINPCHISGIEGTLSYQAKDNKYYFIRSAPGSAVLAEEGTAVETFAAEDKKTSDIIILFAGTNLAPDRDTVGELIRAQKQMLEFLGCERYLIVGLTSLAMAPDIVPVNQALAEEFGEHFLDVRAYLLEHGLEDAKIKPSAQDEKDLKAGEIPSSLRVDIVHGNEAFYRIIGEQVYQKLDDMNYISEDDKK